MRAARAGHLVCSAIICMSILAIVGCADRVCNLRKADLARVARVETDRSFGSGFLVAEDALLTAGHVVDGTREFVQIDDRAVPFILKTSWDAEQDDPEKDWALLWVPRNLRDRPVPPALIIYIAPDIGAEVVVMGYTLKRRVSASEAGRPLERRPIEDEIERRCIRTAVAPAPEGARAIGEEFVWLSWPRDFVAIGFSGAPVFLMDDGGDPIGVVGICIEMDYAMTDDGIAQYMIVRRITPEMIGRADDAQPRQ